MEHTGDQEREEARRRLLEEGARSYQDAVAALTAYREEIQKICKKVMNNHIENYSSALGVTLKKNEVKNAEWRSFGKWGA